MTWFDKLVWAFVVILLLLCLIDEIRANRN